MKNSSEDSLWIELATPLMSFVAVWCLWWVVGKALLATIGNVHLENVL